MNNLKQTAAAKAANALLTLVSHASDRDVERFLGLLERVAPQPSSKEIVRSVRQQWSQDLSLGRLIKRLLREVNPGCRERFVANFVLNNAWGPLAARREAFAAGTASRPFTFATISPGGPGRLVG